MLCYGNDVTDIIAPISEAKNGFLKMIVPDGRELHIPKLFVRSPVLKTDKPQLLKIETWFLKQQRVIPLA